MKIACIADKSGRVQHSRMLLLQKMLPKLDMHVFCADEEFSLKTFDIVYYTHYIIAKNVPFSGPQITSITSHKCLRNLRETMERLRKFTSISVNNRILLKKLTPHVRCKIFYTPNGVDTKKFYYNKRNLSDEPVFGWVGNKDRATKNYQEIVVPLKKRGIRIKEVAPSKKDDIKDLKTKSEMVEFYHDIDYFLVTSSTEGTPNPALEAMSCGVPVITTEVGNMTEIVKDGVNGLFCGDNLSSFLDRIDKIHKVDNDGYQLMRRAARDSIEPEWSWENKVKAWEKFFNASIKK